LPVVALCRSLRTEISGAPLLAEEMALAENPENAEADRLISLILDQSKEKY
jgi:hypothetical protein